MVLFLLYVLLQDHEKLQVTVNALLISEFAAQCPTHC